MNFRTHLVDTADGSAMFGVVEVQDPRNGTWRRCDQTRAYREYPRLVRARTAAESLARQWAKKLNPGMIRHVYEGLSAMREALKDLHLTDVVAAVAIALAVGILVSCLAILAGG